jgi:DNA-binding MarR family transcriptional regulator
MESVETDMNDLELAIRQFMQAMKRPQRWTKVQVKAGINLDRSIGIILIILYRHAQEKPYQIQALAQHLAVEAPMITRKTQELEALGYIERVPNQQDRRAVDLIVTPAGTAVAQKIWIAQRSLLAQSIKNWTTDDRRQFIKLLNRFSNDI